MNAKPLILLLFLFCLLPLASAVCGDNYCSGSEDRCTCPQDCGTCKGDAPGICQVWKCDVNKVCQSVTKLHCCGNELCELGEDYGNCQPDCLPTEITIKVLEPDFEDYFVKGEEVLFKVQATSHGRKAILSDFIVTSSFWGTDTLYNDGEHDDGEIFDDIFANNFIVPKDLEPGSYTVFLDVNFKGATDALIYDFNLNPKIAVKLALEDIYALGDNIKINFETYYKKRLAKNLALQVTVEDPFGEVLYDSVVESASGIYSPSYRTSLLEKPGKWTFTISGTDDYNNTAFASREIDVLKPGKHAFLSFEILTPQEKFFQRGLEVPLKIRLADAYDNPVEGAFIQLLTPAGQLLIMDENAEGIYTKDFTMGYREPSGAQQFKLSASKTQELIELVGEKFFDLEVQPTVMTVEVIQPQKFFLQVGDILPVELLVTYPNGTRVSGANVVLALNGRALEFTEIEPGVYRAEPVLTNDQIGRFDANIFVEDPVGNRGQAGINFEVSGMSLAKQLEVYSPYLISILLVLAVVAFFIWQFYYTKITLKVLQREKKKIMALEKELQHKYFEENLLTRKEFNSLMEEYEGKLDKIETSMKDLKKGPQLPFRRKKK